MKVGIPRALFYYYYYPQWKTFFEQLGWEVIVSPPTNREIAEAGLFNSVNEVCYPVKIYFGHVAWLTRQNLDWIFVPRLISVEQRSYICPKFMGLPDMVRARFGSKLPVIDLYIDFTQRKGWLNSELRRWERLTGCPKGSWIRAWHLSQKALEAFADWCRQRYSLSQAIDIWEGTSHPMPIPAGDLRIGLLGHGYALCDGMISMDIAGKLRQFGAEVIWAESLDRESVESWAGILPKRVFWTVGRTTAGAALLMDRDPSIDGLVYLSCFGCGPDSIVVKTIENYLHHKPLLQITVDEHTGEAGIITRIEAFCDMLQRRYAGESNLSAHGQCLHTNQGTA